MKCPNPTCEELRFFQKCKACGCTEELNPTSGNRIYMVRGRVVAAPEDLEQQRLKQVARTTPEG